MIKAIESARSRVGLLAIIASTLAVACMTDPGGYVYSIANESDRTVLVELHTYRDQTYRVGHGMTGGVDANVAGPGTSRWLARVFDESCRLVGTVDLGEGRLTVHIDPSGAVNVIRTDDWRQPDPPLEFVTPAVVPACAGSATSL